MATQYRADHVGSFLRPAEVKEARQAFVAGQLTEDALRKVEDEHILRVIELQKQSGIGIYTDGEIRRSGWAGGFGESVGGYIEGTPAVSMPFQGGRSDWVGAGITPDNPIGVPGGGGGGRVIGGKLTQTRRLTGHESAFIKHDACRFVHSGPRLQAGRHGPGIRVPVGRAGRRGSHYPRRGRGPH